MRGAGQAVEDEGDQWDADPGHELRAARQPVVRRPLVRPVDHQAGAEAADGAAGVERRADGGGLRAREAFGWPKRCKLARAFLRKQSYKRLKLAQLLGRLGVFLT